MSDKVDDGGPAFPVCPGQEGPFFDRFVARIDGGDWSPQRCWEWRGAVTAKGGYGVFAPSKRVQYRAHRYALMAYTGRAPAQMVLHKCDNPRCVNPMHLMEGDHGENMRQMAERRRATREERHHKSKLTFHEAVAIAVLHASGDYTTTELGAMFGVSKATAIAVASGVNWPDAFAIADAMLAARKGARDE
jgi:hypothetical protein